MKKNVAAQTLSLRAMAYWNASRAWNGVGNGISLAEQNKLLNSALDENKQLSTLYKLTCAQIDRTIKYGAKPKRGLVKYKKTVVQPLRKVNAS